MKLTRCLGVLLLVSSSFVAHATTQEPRAQPITKAEGLFFEAFWNDQGAMKPRRAFELYAKFLAEHRDHRYASRAARFALDTLIRTRRNERAKSFREDHKELLAASVKPGINSSFRDPKLDPKTYVRRFEGESREVFKNRAKLMKTLGIKEGMSVADIGAGTGLFTWMMAKDVGPKGKVYAVEISDGMIQHLGRIKKQRKAEQVKIVACTERSCMLPKNSCDLIWICDTYHHFEFPPATLASIHAALKPGGELVVVDFERIPGKTRAWILGHVRAGKEVFRKEIETAGFRFVREEKTPLKENYFIRFVKI